MTRFARKRLGLVSWLVPLILSAGCGGAPAGTPLLQAPGIAPARTALVATLDAWKSGRREGGTIGSNPSIGIVDSLRAERLLIDYEILGALSVVDKARPFAVRLVLESPRGTLTCRYVVLGQDPLWVFRQDDLDMMLHWEHKESAGDAGAAATVKTDKPRSPAGG